MVSETKKKSNRVAGKKKEKRKQKHALGAPSPDRYSEAHQRRSGLKRCAGNNSLRLTLGMTCPNRNCFAVDPASGTAVYPASGVAVLLDTLSCKQLGYIQASKQSISCVNFSPDGQFILLGEQGYMPALTVWSKERDQEVAEFQGHEYGVAYAAFSRNMDLLVSLGTNHDGYIFVWSWPSKERISCNRFAELIYAMSFSRADPFFVTCGSHHIRFWYPDTEAFRLESDTPLLLGRSVIMSDNKTRTYVDVAFGQGRSEKFVFSVTNCGLICKINSQRQVTNFLKVQDSELTTVQASDDQLFIGTVSGHVHFFNAITMQYKCTISVPMDASLLSQAPKPSGYTSKVSAAKTRGRMYLGLDNVHKQLTAVLDNGDLCIWDICIPDAAKTKFFASGHNKVVSSSDNCHLKSQDNDGGACDAVFSVAHDGTMRQWKLSMDCKVMCTTTKALYTGSYNSRDSATCETEVITVIKANQDLKLMAMGDSKGLITVYDAESLKHTHSILGHSRGVTVISFCNEGEKNQKNQLMLSGGRDRLINVYDVSRNFQMLNSMCIHSGSITALDTVQGADNLMLISSALDRNVIMSCMCNRTPQQITCIPRQCRHTTASVIDIRVCPKTHWAVLGKSNAVLTIVDTGTFQSVRSFRACKDDKASLERLCLDATGAYLLTACSDRSINLLSVPLGHRLACLTGHAAPVSGLALTAGGFFLVSSSRDGCIFIWELPGRARRRACFLFRQAVRKAKVKAKKASRVSLSSVELSARSVESSKAPTPTILPRASHSSQNLTVESPNDVL